MEKKQEKLKKVYNRLSIIKWVLRVLMVLFFVVPFFIYPPSNNKDWIIALCLFSIGVMGIFFLYINMKVEKIERIVKKSMFPHKYKEIKKIGEELKKNQSEMSDEEISDVLQKIEKKENDLDTLIEAYLKSK